MSSPSNPLEIVDQIADVRRLQAPFHEQVLQRHPVLLLYDSVYIKPPALAAQHDLETPALRERLPQQRVILRDGGVQCDRDAALGKLAGARIVFQSGGLIKVGIQIPDQAEHADRHHRHRPEDDEEGRAAPGVMPGHITVVLQYRSPYGVRCGRPLEPRHGRQAENIGVCFVRGGEGQFHVGGPGSGVVPFLDPCGAAGIRRTAIALRASPAGA